MMADVVDLKTGGELAAMRGAGRVVARVLARTEELAAPGVTLLDLDAAAREVLAEAGATSPFLGYRPGNVAFAFPAVICASVNDVALHGIPDGYRLRDGDLVSIDVGATLEGWTGDAAVSFVVGTASPQDLALVEVTRRALDAGIAAAVVGARLGDVCSTIGRIARESGYGVNTDFGGHGIGRTMHEDPSIPNDGPAGRGMRLRHGLTLAIEPWFMAGGLDTYSVDDDGWTLRTGDGSRAAHCEHTVAITDDGPQVLTLP